MKGLGVSVGVALTLLSATAMAQAPGWSPPPEAQRCPSKWGADDERGAGNHQKAATVLRAVKLIETGEVIELGHTLRGTMPLSGTRRFDLHTKRTFMNTSPNQRGSNEELVITELGQVGTQLDGFPHQTIGNQMYNCFRVDETSTRSGFSKLGVQNTGQIFTRGVLIDVAAHKGVDMLPDEYEITVADLQTALAKQNMKLEPGDAILIHTGWGKLWEKDNARYLKSCPGIGVAAAEWLVKQDPLVLGADNSSVEVTPSRTPNASLPVHQIALTITGVHLLENIKLDELAAKTIYEFAFVMQPLKLQGGSGSTVSPVAIH